MPFLQRVELHSWWGLGRGWEGKGGGVRVSSALGFEGVCCVLLSCIMWFLGWKGLSWDWRDVAAETGCGARREKYFCQAGRRRAFRLVESACLRGREPTNQLTTAALNVGSGFYCHLPLAPCLCFWKHSERFAFIEVFGLVLLVSVRPSDVVCVRQTTAKRREDVPKFSRPGL